MSAAQSMSSSPPKRLNYCVAAKLTWSASSGRPAVRRNTWAPTRWRPGSPSLDDAGSVSMDVGGRLLDEIGDSTGVRDVDGVAAWRLYGDRPGPVRHFPLSRRRDHPVVGGNKVPAGPDLPSRCGDLAIQGFHAPRDLRVRHEGRQIRANVRSERGGKLRLVQEQEAVDRRQDGRHRSSRRLIVDQALNKIATARRKSRDEAEPGDLGVVASF